MSLDTSEATQKAREDADKAGAAKAGAAAQKAKEDAARESAKAEKDAAATAAADAKVAATSAKRHTILEGLSVAHDNHAKALDALIASHAAGNAVTGAQLLALKAPIKGMSDTLAQLSSSTVDLNTPLNTPV
jgi:hypothetical protein